MMPWDKNPRWQSGAFLAKRRMVRLGQGFLTVQEVAEKLAIIETGQAKILTIDGFTQAMGPGLSDLLGAQVIAWNSNYQQLLALQPTVSAIKAALEAANYTWDATKDTALAQWNTVVNALVAIMASVTEPGGTIPPPGGGGGTTPPVTPPVSTPPSYTAYYVVGGAAGAILLGAIGWAIFK